MHEELNYFIRNDVWKFITYLDSRNIIKTKWVFKKKSDKYGTIIKKKTRLWHNNTLKP
jgi:hypothetical protein